MVFPLFAFIAGVGQIQDAEPTWGLGWEGYAKRYGAAVADTVCSMITTGSCRRCSSRIRATTRGARPDSSRACITPRAAARHEIAIGPPQFNLSEIGGTLIVANISNLYPEDERTRNATLERWATQAM
jgi:hypothetical protein